MQNSFLTSKDLRKFALYISNSHSIPIWIILYLNLLVLGVNFTKHLINGNNDTLSYMGCFCERCTPVITKKPFVGTNTSIYLKIRERKLKLSRSKADRCSSNSANDHWSL